MRQLTSLDAQFLNVESAADLRPRRLPGHLRPVDRAGRQARRRGRHAGCSSERLHLLPPLRWRLVEVPLGLDLPYWVDDPDFDLDFHVRETALPPPGDDRQLAETVAAHLRPPARPRPAAVGALRHPRARGRARGAADQDPPLGRRRHLAATRSWPCCSTRAGRARRSTAAPSTSRRPRRIPRDREMLARGLRGLPRQPLRALRSLPDDRRRLHRPPGRERAARRADALARLLAVRRTLGSDESDGRPRGDQGARRR